MKKSETLNLISDFTDNTEMDFVQCHNGYQALEKAVSEYPEYSSFVLSAVAFSSKKDVFCADLAPAALRVFTAAAQNVGDNEVLDCLKGLFAKNKSFALMCCKNLPAQRPQLAESVFETLMFHAVGIDVNMAYKYRGAIVEAIKNGGRAAEMLDKAMSNPELAPLLYKSLNEIYKSCPETGERILQLLGDEKHLTAENYTAFYNNLETIVLLNETPRENAVYVENYGNATMAERALSLMEEHIKDDENDIKSLSAAYKAAGHIGQIMPEYAERVEALIRSGMGNKNNAKISLKCAYRALGDFEKLRSQVSFHQRVEKEAAEPFGLKNVDQIDNETPCILVLGGDGVRGEKELNGYLGDVYRCLEKAGLQDKVNVYGVVYDFGEFMNLNCSRTKLMEDYKRQVHLKKEMNEDTLDPKYIRDIFDKAILSRISADGKKIDAGKAAANVRGLHILAHCHGAYTALKLEEMMQAKMKELGYTKEERSHIQKQLLVVAQSPYCPLGESKSTFVSFASVRDLEVSHYNNFERALQAVRGSEKIPFSFFAGRRGNLFLADSMGEGADEHNFWGLSPGLQMSKEGQALVCLEHKILLNGVKNSLEPDKEIPDIRELAVDDDNSRQLFDKAVSNGEALYNKMYAISMGVAKYRAQHEK